jgi:hypothetical protein
VSYIDEKEEALLVLAYPDLYEKDRAWITEFRKRNDPLFYGIAEPHFTLVFPTFGINYEVFLSEMMEKSRNLCRFKFFIRCAMMNNDRLSDYYHVFLSPDEGHSNIVKTHDHLYSGIIRDTLRLDVDFYSHIAIGSSLDPEECKRHVDSINSQNLAIEGSVKSLTVVSYGNKQLRNRETIDLK